MEVEGSKQVKQVGRRLLEAASGRQNNWVDQPDWITGRGQNAGALRGGLT